MATVRMAEKKVRVDDVSIPLLSGEMHYWRLSPNSWGDCLRRVKEMGLQTVATYVCWDFHEYAPGCFDFRGETDPRRNLVGFLDLLTEENFWIIIRPGPYIYSEWRNGGVPDYAARHHRLSPEFQAAARPYMQAVTETLQPYLATQGGRIALWQADNEIDPWPHWHTEALGLGRSVGSFHEFLRERYPGVEALNETWKTCYTIFEQARATCTLVDNTAEQLGRYLDFCRFRHWYVTEVARWAVDSYRDLGADVPIILNTYSGVTTQPAADLEQIADLVGADLYSSREFAKRTEEPRFFMDSVRYLRAYSRLPYIAEFEAGIWHDWLDDVGALGPNHYRLICLSALLAGAAGWNWYMIVNRDNWYMSPINEWGRTRPELFEAFCQITRLFNEIDPPSLTKLTNTALLLDPLQKAAQRPGQDILRAFYEADIDHEFYDPNVGDCDKPILFYVGTNWLSASAQDKLLNYVENGGHLVCIGAYPRFDDQMRPLNRLAIVEPSGIVDASPEGLRLKIEGSEAILTSPWAFNYEYTPGCSIVGRRLAPAALKSEEDQLRAHLQVGSAYTIGYTEPRGAGKLTVIGLAPSPALLRWLHRQFDVPVQVHSSTPAISTALFERDGIRYLIAVNSGNETRTADIELFDQQAYHVEDLMRGKHETAAGKLAVHMPRKEGTVLRLTPLKGQQ